MSEGIPPLLARPQYKDYGEWWQDDAAKALWESLGQGLGRGVDLARSGYDVLDRGTDRLGELAWVLGAEPNTVAAISDPLSATADALTPSWLPGMADRFGAWSAGFPGGSGIPGGGPAPGGIAGVPNAPVGPIGQVGDSGGGFSTTLAGGFNPSPVKYEAPAPADYTEAQGILRDVTAGERPTAPSEWDLRQAQLAGMAGGAAEGRTVGEILARAGAGGYAAREGKLQSFEAALRAYEDRHAQLEVTRGQALANIEAKQEEFRRGVAGDALQADVANMNQQIAMMQLTKPQSDIVGGYLVLNQWDPRTGKLAVQRYLVNPLIEQIAMMGALSRGRSGAKFDSITLPLPGGGKLTTYDPALQAHIVRTGMELASDSPLSKKAIEIAEQAAFPNSTDPHDEAESLRLRDPKLYTELVLKNAGAILLSDGINQGREIPMGQE